MSEESRAESCDHPHQLVAVVTGGGRGIGRSIALRLARDGFAVAVAARTEPQVASVAQEIGAMGGRAAYVTVDITDENSIQRGVRYVEATLGRPSVLVNNAGVHSVGKFEDIPAQHWAWAFDVSVIGAGRMIQAVLRTCGRKGAAGSSTSPRPPAKPAPSCSLRTTPPSTRSSAG